MLTGDFFITQSESRGNTYFLFRELIDKSYIEVELQIVDGLIRSEKPIHEHEAFWLKKNLLEKSDLKPNQIWK